MKIIDVLKLKVWARERKHKNLALAYVLKQNYPELEGIEGKKIAEIVGDVLTEDRQWRKTLEDNPELRGSDYGDKDALEQEAQIALGYGSGETVREFKKVIKS